METSARTGRGAIALALYAGLALAGTGLVLAAIPAETSRLAGPAALLAQPPLPTAHPDRVALMAVARAGRRLVAVGEHGVIALSDDDGRSWRGATAPVDVTLTALRFADEKVGWAVGHLGVVLKTEDGGERWVKQLDGIAAAQLALAAARATGDEAALQDAQRLVDDGPDKPFLDVLVEGPAQATIVGAFNLAYTTRDGGARWAPAAERFDNPQGMHVYGLVAHADGLVAVGEQGMILRADAGDTPLAPIESPYDGSLFGVLPFGDAQLLAYGLRGHAFRSIDGGRSWHAAEVDGGGASLNCATRLADGRLAIGDQAGRIYLSDDTGARFKPAPVSWGAPLTGMVQAADGALVLSSFAGMTRIAPEQLAANAETTTK